jgi:capsular polysaccharide biosynthesis protein
LFDQVAARSNQSNLESQNNHSNVSLLSEARPPNVQSSPRVLLNTALGSILALVAAVAAALSFEAADRRVRLASDIVDAFDLPILAAIPKPSGRFLGGRAEVRTKQRLLSGATKPYPSST